MTAAADQDRDDQAVARRLRLVVSNPAQGQPLALPDERPSFPGDPTPHVAMQSRTGRWSWASPGVVAGIGIAVGLAVASYTGFSYVAVRVATP